MHIRSEITAITDIVTISAPHQHRLGARLCVRARVRIRVAYVCTFVLYIRVRSEVVRDRRKRAARSNSPCDKRKCQRFLRLGNAEGVRAVRERAPGTKMREAGIMLISTALTCVVIGNAYYQRKQFYPTVVHITKSNPSMTVS